MYSDFVPLGHRPKEAARVIGVGRTTLYELVKAQELELVKLSARTSLITHASLVAFLARRRGEQA